MARAARTFVVGVGNRGGTQAVAMVAITQFNWGKTFRSTRSKLDNQNRPCAQSKLLSTKPTSRAIQFQRARAVLWRMEIRCKVCARRTLARANRTVTRVSEGLDSFSASRARVSRGLGLCATKPGGGEPQSGS